MSKAHSLLRLTEKIVSNPQMMEVAAFNRVATLLEDRNNGLFELAIKNDAKSYKRELAYNPDTLTGIIELQGPLTYMHYEPMCGESPTSYQSLTADFEEMISKGAKTIVLDTDSPGGEAYAVFETARNLRKMADENDVKILTYVDGMAASAAYALASISDEIIMNPSAEVGSIGVVVRLRNTNEAMQKMGVKDTYVYAGKSKIPFNSDGDFAEEFLEDLQEKVNMLYGDFISHVAQMRGIGEDSVKNTEAKTFLADKAIELGLADKVMEVEEFYTYLSTVALGEKPKMLKSRFLKSLTGDSVEMQELVELQSAHAELQASTEQLTIKFADMEAALVQKEAELVSIKEQLTQFQAQAEAAALAAEEARVEAEAQAAQARMNARKERLVASVGEEEGEALMASLGTLDDVAFETVASSLEKKAKAIESSPLFKELGVAEQGDEDTLSATAKILKAQYQNS